MMFVSSQKGLTLVELIVAIAIVALLSAALIATLNPFDQIRKANDARRKSDLAQIQRVLEAAYQDNGGKYPASDSNFNITNFKTAVGIPWGDPWQPYITALPKDPTGKKYVYYSPPSQNGQAYYLYASLDRGAKDPQVCAAGAVCSSVTSFSISQTACGGTCNFAVTSPNVSP